MLHNTLTSDYTNDIFHELGGVGNATRYNHNNFSSICYWHIAMYRQAGSHFRGKHFL